MRRRRSGLALGNGLERENLPSRLATKDARSWPWPGKPCSGGWQRFPRWLESALGQSAHGRNFFLELRKGWSALLGPRQWQ